MRVIRSAQNPLEPLASALGVLIMLLAGLLLLSLLVHQAAWGNGPVCASVSPDDASIFSGPVSVPGLAPGSKASLAAINICASHPASALRVAGLFAAWPYLLLWFAFLLRLNRLFKSAMSPGGLYSAQTAGRLRSLGWLMTGGGLAASVIESAARIFIFTRVVHYRGLGWFEPTQINFSVTTLVVGLVLLTTARVMSIGATMRSELDVTI